MQAVFTTVRPPSNSERLASFLYRWALAGLPRPTPNTPTPAVPAKDLQ